MHAYNAKARDCTARRNKVAGIKKLPKSLGVHIDEQQKVRATVP